MNVVSVLGIALLLLGAFVLWRADKSKSNPVDFAHLLIENDRTSLRKFMELLAGLASTWVLVYLAVADKLTEGYYLAYLGCWVARTLLGPLSQAKATQIAK